MQTLFKLLCIRLSLRQHCIRALNPQRCSYNQQHIDLHGCTHILYFAYAT